ncbi:MAG: hypothetical protein NTZ78_04120 [Candidatus Aureabacteria bacterium]|nr:hypothetical protein [Candidatus Auribacterota bacterium]
MRRLTVAVLSVMLMAGLCGMVVAGSIDSPGAPSAGSGMYTLSQTYDYLNSGIDVTPVPAFQEPGAAPGSTMKTMKQIYEDIRAKFTQCPVTADNVESGVKFFCTQPENWGIQTGTLSALPRPTATPTITPTPTKTWYEQYGPTAGTGDVVQIGSMYVASKKDGTGGFAGGYKHWADACSWAEGLVWLDRDDWRLPTGGPGGEASEIYSVKDSAVGFTYYGNMCIWTATSFNDSDAYYLFFLNGEVSHFSKMQEGVPVRVVRGSGAP